MDDQSRRRKQRCCEGEDCGTQVDRPESRRRTEQHDIDAVEKFLITVEPVKAPILGNVAAAAHAHPGRVILELVGPTIREAGALLRERYLPQGYFSVATFQEPGSTSDNRAHRGAAAMAARSLKLTASARWPMSAGLE